MAGTKFPITTTNATTFNLNTSSVGNLDLQQLAQALWPLLEPMVVASFPGQKGTGPPLLPDITPPATPPVPTLLFQSGSSYLIGWPHSVDPNIPLSVTSGTKDYTVYLSGVPQSPPIPDGAAIAAPTLTVVGTNIGGGPMTGTDNGSVLTATSVTGDTGPSPTTDEFVYVSSIAQVPAPGSFVVVALHITAETLVGGFSKRGVRMNASLANNAVYYDMLSFGPTNGLKGEQRVSTGAAAGGRATVTFPGYPFWVRNWIDSTGLLTRDYSTNSVTGALGDGTWTVYDTQTPAFGTAFYIGRFADPNTGGGTGGTTSCTYDHYYTAGLAGLTYAGTVAAGTTASDTVSARDNALNVSPQSPALSIAGPPLAPVLSVGTITSSTVALNWTAPAGAITYNVYQGGVRVQSGLASPSTTVTGLSASTTYSFQVTAVGTVGEGPVSNTQTVTTSASAGIAALRMGNSWIGGSQVSAYNSSTYQTYVSKCQGPVLLNWQAGWDSPSISPHPMRDIMGSIKALAIAAGRTPPLCGLYYGYTYILPTGLDPKLYAAFNTNFWWLYTVYHSGSIVVNSSGNKLGNYTAGSQVDASTGFNARQWLAHYIPDWMINGGSLGLATGPNVANPNLDFINSDDGYVTLPPPSGDWNRTGTGTSGTAASFRQAYAGLGNDLRSATGRQWGFNTSQVGQQLGSPASPEYTGLADLGFMDQQIGTAFTYEYNSSIANAILDWQLQGQAVKSTGDLVFGHYSIQQSDGSDGITFNPTTFAVTNRSFPWQGFRHAICAMACIVQNGVYYPSLTGANDAGQTPIWPDCMSVNVANRQAYTYPNVDAGLGWTGPFTDPPQTAPWQGNVYRRRAQFATFYWLPRGKPSQTITFSVPQYHYLGYQNPSFDNGLQVTSLTLAPSGGGPTGGVIGRDGAILCNQ